MGIEVIKPDVNESQNDFTISDGNKIRIGLGAIKNVGNKAIESIIESRNKTGRFTSIPIFANGLTCVLLINR